MAKPLTLLTEGSRGVYKYIISCGCSLKKVTKKHVKDGEHLVVLEIGAYNPKGGLTTRGTAVVSLPSRGK